MLEKQETLPFSRSGMLKKKTTLEFIICVLTRTNQTSAILLGFYFVLEEDGTESPDLNRKELFH